MMRKVRGWVWARLCERQPVPYSLCLRPVEGLAAFQALRVYQEQRAVDQALGLVRTTQGAEVPPPTVPRDRAG